MAVVRHIAINILKNFSAKMGLAQKRHRCSYDDAFSLLSYFLFMRKP